ncbi:MAG: AI-2E family transporter [Candidatus Woesebacteria bacterium]
MQNYRVEISVKTLLYIIGFGLLFLVLSRTFDIVILLLLGFVLMTALHPIVLRLQRLRFSRVAAVLSVYAMLIATLVITFAVLVPPLVEQTLNLLHQFDLQSVPYLSDLKSLQLTYDQVSTLVSTYGGSFGTVFSYITSTFSVIFSFFTILVMSLYLLLEREHLYKYSAFLFRTKDREERSQRLFNEIEESLGTWVRGEFILMVTIGTMTYVGLTLLKIPYALPLAILAGFLEALPNLGPTIAAIPAVIVAYVVTGIPLMGVLAALLYWLIQSIENNFIVPFVMKRTVGISPLVSIVLILAGLRFGSVIGALLVIPIFIIVRVILREFSPEIHSVLRTKEN